MLNNMCFKRAQMPLVQHMLNGSFVDIIHMCRTRLCNWISTNSWSCR